ncbi:MAG: hypothetical protein KDD43_07085 [Bdellovibrionales bacterium]|nr:hypothetical protein [Bdellovibrionales bacterium]
MARINVGKGTIDVTKIIQLSMSQESVQNGIRQRYFDGRVEKARAIAENTYKIALRELARITSQGVAGARPLGAAYRGTKFSSLPSVPVSIKFNTVRGSDSFVVDWKLHTERYSRYKAKLGLGVGRFWTLRGDLSNELNLAAQAARVTSEVSKVKKGGVLVRRQKGVRIRFSARLRFSSLGGTLNSMVRTPLLTGDANRVDLQSLVGGGGFSKLAFLENYRPFVAQLSARLGTSMRQEFLRI